MRFRWIHGWDDIQCRSSVEAFCQCAEEYEFDAAFLPADHQYLNELLQDRTGFTRFLEVRERLSGCVIGVLPETCELEDAVLAASAGFDGIAAGPFYPQNIRSMLQTAMARQRQRRQQRLRYRHLRQICRQVNQKRGQLRRKVDLLCNDFVQSSQDMAQTIHRYRDAYDFQSGLIGEFDLNCLLHKALQMICGRITGSSGAIYLNHKENFEAHVIHPSFEPGYLLFEQEELLADTIVSEVLLTRGTVSVADASVWQPVVSMSTECLEGICLAGSPVIGDGDLLAILILYRSGSGYTAAEIRRLESYLPSLARSLQAMETLKSCI